MNASLRKSLLTMHIVSSAGWIGALLAFLALALADSAGADTRAREATAYAMALITWKVILPLCVLSVASGLAQALEGPLLRSYWVLFKALIGAVATGVLLLKLQPIQALPQLHSAGAEAAGGLRLSLIVHAVGGLVLLLGSAVLGIYRPPGTLPRRGDRSSPGAPRWVKVVGSLLAALVLVLVVMAAGGRHGPWMHSMPT